jgi:NAD-dependent SIR2 family protein deacetylase
MSTATANQLAAFLLRHDKVAVLSGAGCSTASGIPDYRADDGSWKQAQPVQYADFAGNAAVRRRYWARSFSGWQRIRAAQPNSAHCALATLHNSGRVSSLITQNVDDLHRRAGSRTVIDLHGILRRVRCLSCRAVVSREHFQSALQGANPEWSATPAAILPDGDAQVDVDDFDHFVVPDCTRCGGVVKPDVVFFGESVPAGRVADATKQVARAAALMVVGSSLMVYSGFRFVRQASQAGKPIAIVNRGITRGDKLATLRLQDDCGELLATVVQQLERSGCLEPGRAH